MTDRGQVGLEQLALRLSELPELQSARAAARDVFLNHPYATTPDGRRSLEDAALQHFYGAIQLATNSDPANPEILAVFLYEHPLGPHQVFPSALHGGLENPDNVYRIIPVASQWQYRLTGVRHEPAPAQVTYELMDAISGIDGIGEQLGLLMDRDMAVEDDGSFTITIDSDPADGRPNHIQCPPGAKTLFIRDTLSDWRTQRADRLRIERVGGPDRPPRTQQQVIDEAVDFVPRYARFWNEFREAYVTRMELRTNAFDPPIRRTGGWGYVAHAHFSLDDDEALVFTTEEGCAPYHAVLVGNHWWITQDASRRPGAYNMAQATRNTDGSTTFVISSRDPGVANWLDTGGLHTGIVQVRWQGAPPDSASPAEIRDVRVAPVAQLAHELVPMSREQRVAELADRHESYLRRLEQI